MKRKKRKNTYLGYWWVKNNDKEEEATRTSSLNIKERKEGIFKIPGKEDTIQYCIIQPKDVECTGNGKIKQVRVEMSKGLPETERSKKTPGLVMKNDLGGKNSRDSKDQGDSKCQGLEKSKAG